jgi:succinoglycan biosynthesis transport protein ExoP
VLAADFVNTLTQEFVNMTVERRARLIQATAQLFSQQLDELKSNLDRSVAQLQDFTRKNGILATGEGDASTNIEQARLTELLGALGRAHEDRVLQQSKFDRLNGAGGDVPDTVDDEVLRNHEVRLADLQRQKADLGATLTPKHYKVRELDAQIAETQSGIDRRRNAIRNRIQDQYQAARRREDTLQTEYRREAGLIPGASSNAVQYRVLNGEVQTSRRLYEEMLVKLREATAASAMRSSNMQVIDAASASGAPAKPSLPVYTAAGLLGGLFLGLARILLKPADQMALQDPQQLATNIHLRVLGAIPDTGIETGLLKRLAGKTTSSPELISWKRTESVVTESFRNAFASVLLSDQLETPHTLALTSALPGEGKTTVAVNLAVQFARTNRRVLLIDGDMRRPRLHQIFGLDNGRGFSSMLNALARQETFEAGEFPMETHIPGLHVIPAGPASDNVTHLLYSRATQRILWRLRDDFDTILIDTPPVSVSDARGLARLADGVVLVVRAHRTPSQTVTAAAQRLSEDGARVLGTVLNYWNPKKSGSANSSYVYGYGYYPSA